MKNQWGINWGMKGYIHITRDKNYNCKIGAGVYVMGEDKVTFIFILFLLLVMMMICTNYLKMAIFNEKIHLIKRNFYI